MGADAQRLVAVGLSHHTAPVDVRERLALDDAGVREELAWLTGEGIAREALVLSTCNRVELYAVPGDGEGLERLRHYMTARRAAGQRLDPYLYWHRGRDAARHLFRVACSLDSLVVGEPQILGQVKQAVRLAGEAHTLGAVLQRLAQRSLHVAKHVRTHTDIGRYTVGIGNAGVQLAEQIFGTLQGRRALLVGTGEMGRQVATAMVHAGLDELLVANRTFERAVELAQLHGGTPVPYERIGDYLARVDVVITATGAQRPILDLRRVEQAVRARRGRPLFLVDLAVPRNIAPEVERLDLAFLFNVDDLTRVMELGKRAREAASREAEAYVEDEATRFAEQLETLAVEAGIGRIGQRAEALRRAELARTAAVLDRLDPQQRARVEAMTRALTKKLLHFPLRHVREAVRRGDLATVEALLAAWDEPEA